MGKAQLRHLGDRPSILVVRFLDGTFYDAGLRESLAGRVGDIECLGGILLALHTRAGRYETHYIENASAVVPVKKETLEPIRSALGLAL